MARSGALISEVPPGTEAVPQRFPARNRLIAGLALLTIVVEAGEGSGALTNRLLVEGAIPVPHPTDLEWLVPACLDRWQRELAGAVRRRGREEETGATGAPPGGAGAGAGPGGTLAERLLAALDELLPVDELARRLGEPAGPVAAALLRLQLEGRVEAVAGGLYLRCSSPPSLYKG